MSNSVNSDQHLEHASVESLGLKSQVALDLANYLDQFPNKSFAMRILSKETGLNEKTIKRLLKKSNRPSYQTLLKLYPVFFEEFNFQKLLGLLPPTVKEEVEKYSVEEKTLGRNRSQELLEVFKSNPLAAEFFILAGSGSLNLSTIGFRYGEYGQEIVQMLQRANLIHEVNKGEFILSKTAPQLDGNCFKFLGEYFIKKFSKPSNAQLLSENTISFYAEGLNQKGKEEWLKIDRECFYKKLEVARSEKFQGDLPMFTFNATDSIQMEKLS